MDDCQLLYRYPVLVGNVFDKMDAHPSLIGIDSDSSSIVAPTTDLGGQEVGE